MSESFIALMGVSFVNLRSLERYTHSIAGLIIALTAGIILILGHSH